MRVDVYNREQVETLAPIANTVIISISNPGQPAALKNGWEDVLRLEFHDYVHIPDDCITPETVLFNQLHVDIVHAFVETHLDKDFVVHCDAGVSRSVAVGLYLKDIHEADLKLHAIHTTQAANSRVHRGLVRKYWTHRLGGVDDAK